MVEGNLRYLGSYFEPSLTVMRIYLAYTIFLFLNLVSCKDRDVVRHYYDNGTLEDEYQVKNGIKDGFARIYFEDGTLKQDGHYKNDLRDGWHVLYYSIGKINQKTLYTNENGKEVATRTLKFNQKGDLVSDFTFAQKKITLEIKNQMPYRVGDTLLVKLKIENAKYSYSEATIGFFDEYLNVLRYPNENPVYISGNKAHEIVMRVRPTKPGPDTITWLVRDFDFKPRTDSTGTSIGEESYFGYPIQVEER